MYTPVIKHDLKEVECITPEVFIRYKKKAKNIKDDINFPKICILTSQRNIIDYIKLQYKAISEEGWVSERSELFSFNLGNIKVGIINTLIGAPIAAMLTELLIACGAETFIVIGPMGGISSDLKVGDIVLVSKSLRDEGTSYNYLPPSEYSYPDDKLNDGLSIFLNKKGINFSTGPIWTTDAFFRSLPKEVSSNREKGILGIEMETSAIFAVATFRKKKAVSLLYISDLVNISEWQSGLYGETAEKIQKQITDLIVDFIPSL